MLWALAKSVSGTELEDIASGTEFVLRTLSFEKLPTVAEELAKRLCRGRGTEKKSEQHNLMVK